MYAATSPPRIFAFVVPPNDCFASRTATTGNGFSESRSESPSPSATGGLRTCGRRSIGGPVCTWDDVARGAIGNNERPIEPLEQRAATIQSVGKRERPTIDKFNRP